MTKEELLRRIIEGELFKSIEQSEEFSDFLHARENEIGIEVTETLEYLKIQADRERLEKEFMSLYPDPETGKKKVLLFGSLIEKQSAISDMTHYEAGFTEGIKFIVGMLAM